MAKFIETALPLAEINNAAIREKAGKTGHPANLHMWWGRSPVSSSIAALAAAVLETSEESSAKDMELLAGAASGEGEWMERQAHERLSDAYLQTETGEIPSNAHWFSPLRGTDLRNMPISLHRVNCGCS